MSRSRCRTTSEVSDNNCVVCCRNVTIYAIGECDHPVCYECATRMRVLCRQNECPICRRELPKVIFVKEKELYSSVSNVVFPRHDRRYNIYFTDSEIEGAYCKLLEHRCNLCKNDPATTFANFNFLKDHTRRDHEKYYCDLCVEHLKIFSHERKCYSRSELARHRRVGDTDDTSHRGHPLCEFCDERFLENDELFRHLRREHFFCHFCDADGFHHYYNDYEYLREHFRVEHFLCEEDDCQQEKFTTAFRSEIDLKAHKTVAHNKTLSKVQAKQARTLELEFSIKPRGPLPSSSAVNSGGASGGVSNSYADDSDHYRKFRGGGYAPNRGGGGNGIYASRHATSEANDYHQRGGETGSAEASKMEIDINSEDFPKLGELNAFEKQNALKLANNKNGGASHSVDTLARKLAKLNRFTVGNSLGDNEFPALSHKGETSKPTPSKLWASSGMASFSVTSSTTTPTTTTPAKGMKKKTLTLKLNSQDDFPGLANKTKRHQGSPSLSLHMQHKQKVVPRDDDCSSAAAKPVVTRLASTQNITFLNPPPPTTTVITKSSKAEHPNVARSTDGWYVLKKKGSKKESDPNVDLSADNDFPALETKTSSVRSKNKEPIGSSQLNNCWKIGGDDTRAELEVDSMLEAKQQAKGKKKQKVTTVEERNVVTTDGGRYSPMKNGVVAEPSKKKKKQPPLQLSSSDSSSLTGPKSFNNVSFQTYTENQENEVPVDKLDNFEFSSSTKRSELKIGTLSPSKESIDNGFRSMLSSVDEFPGLPSTGFRRKVTVPPPGFRPPSQVSVGPPPGFNPPLPSPSPKNVTTNPPPGFSGGAISSITFTNSNGQNYMFATSSKKKLPNEYIAPDGFQERNRNLMERLIEILANDKANIANFRLFSGLFRKGEITASDYYAKCSEMMTKGKFASIFVELVTLLPDIGKQQSLLSVHNAIQKQEMSSSRVEQPQVAAQFLICATCQQVLSAKDFRTHMNHHSLNEEYPALNRSNVDPQVSHQETWVKRS